MLPAELFGNSTGPEYGYFPNSSKTWLIVKEEHLGEAKQLFHETGVKISYGGKSNLGSGIWSRRFVEYFVEKKVSKWKNELEHFSDIAMTQTQAAYTAFIHGIKSKWIYLARTTPNIGHLLAPLQEVIHYKSSVSITRPLVKATLDQARESSPGVIKA